MRENYIDDVLAFREEMEAFIPKGALKALTFKQRRSILERDDFKCQVGGAGIPHHCNGRDKWKNGNFKLQVDHIVTQRWLRKVEGKTEEEADSDPNNLITECERFHQTIRHPDMEEARIRGGKQGFKTVFDRRDEACEKGEKYWYSLYDEDLKRQAKLRTDLKEKQGWRYPKIK